MKYNEFSISVCVFTDLLGRVIDLNQAKLPEQSRVLRLTDLLATILRLTYHSPRILIDIVLWLINASAGLQNEQSREPSQSGILATSLTKSARPIYKPAGRQLFRNA